ncbi:Mcm22p Ecym_5156 [Eremothecium cymbalariae DBVPG|uniref:Uncharacterized protein n=1 Tax=Eremothecium cymbalariae (strain CBS 270.75 / DBVPG 7215 / KCTC 17166 / NRRL Y-17582) TaxID=931890 RepID=I6NCZ0_ERECY|nr:hypothetical protein Ecym_5156 [Eremothecium cymbalariae DBVPG\
MENRETTESQWEAFNQRLRHEIENKQFFLKQAQAAVQKLSKTSDVDDLHNNRVAWASLLDTQLFIPDRSDPLGVVLALNREQRTSNSDVGSVLGGTIEQLQIMVHDQEALNDDMSKLNSFLTKRIKDNAANKDIESHHPEPRVSVAEIFENFVGEFLVPDISTSQDRWHEVKDNVLSLVYRLLEKDQDLRLSDFNPFCMALYRLLSKAHMLQEIPGADIPDNPYIRLYTTM